MRIKMILYHIFNTRGIKIINLFNFLGLTHLENCIFGFKLSPESKPPISAVSGEFGFKMLENLKVEISAQGGE